MSAALKPAGGDGTKTVDTAPKAALITVSCDMACNWRLNGRTMGRLVAGQSQTVPAGQGGSATVEAEAADERLTPQQKTVALRAGERREAQIFFTPELQSVLEKINSLAANADTRQRRWIASMKRQWQS